MGKTIFRAVVMADKQCHYPDIEFSGNDIKAIAEMPTFQTQMDLIIDKCIQKGMNPEDAEVMREELETSIKMTPEFAEGIIRRVLSEWIG